MRRLLTPIALALFAALIVVGCGGHLPRSTREKPATEPISVSARDPNVLIVAHDREYPPYEYVTPGGQSAGISIDMIKEVARRMNREVWFHPLPWVDVLKELSNGQADITPGMLYSPERSREWAFSMGWGTATSVVLVRKTSKYKTVKDVVPQVLGAPVGDIEYDMLKRKGVTQLIAAKNTEEGLMKTVIGEADGVGCNREVAQTIFKQHVGWQSALRELGPPLAVTPIMVASRKGNERLLHHISQVIQEMKRDGAF
ncbi:MAG: transporter substrate-binding domain-containing protein [bacterium]